VRTADGDLANCNCPCFLKCDVDPFPTALYVRLNNFSNTAVMGSTVIDITIDFPAATSIFGYGCLPWNGVRGSILTEPGNRLLSLFVQVSCYQDGTLGMKIIITQDAGPPPPAPIYFFESFDIVSCTYCDTTGTAHASVDTCDFEIKCEPFPVPDTSLFSPPELGAQMGELS
jgi:hypothetical protein